MLSFDSLRSLRMSGRHGTLCSGRSDHLLPELRSRAFLDGLGQRPQAAVDRLDRGALRGERGDQLQETAAQQALQLAERRAEQRSGQLLEKRLAGLVEGAGGGRLAL